MALALALILPWLDIRDFDHAFTMERRRAELLYAQKLSPYRVQYRTDWGLVDGPPIADATAPGKQRTFHLTTFKPTGWTVIHEFLILDHRGAIVARHKFGFPVQLDPGEALEFEYHLAR